MVIELAGMAVEKKCDFQKITGGYLSDYEYAYACGKIAHILGIQINPQHDLHIIREALIDGVNNYEPKDKREAVLFGLFPHYVIKNTKDADIELIVKMGMNA